MINPAVSAAVYAVRHSIMRTISVVCTLVVIAGLSWAIYVSFIRVHTKPVSTETIHQEAAKIENVENYYYPEDKGLIGINLWLFEIKLRNPFKDNKVKKIIQKDVLTVDK